MSTTRQRKQRNGSGDLGERLAAKRGIMLDIGCGEQKQPGFVGMDHQPLPGVDVVHEWDVFPWPFENESVTTAIASHVVEHVNPVNGHFIDWMNEVWRILKPMGQLALVTPYAGSPGFWQDPTHCNGCTEATWFYFDPLHPSGFWNFYRPHPWMVEHISYHHTGNLELVLRKPDPTMTCMVCGQPREGHGPPCPPRSDDVVTGT